MFLYRILSNPEIDGEGASAVEAVEAVEEMVSISRSELEALRAAAEQAQATHTEASVEASVEAEAQTEAKANAEAQAEEQKQRDEARFQAELAERDHKAAHWEQAFKDALKEKELATQLSGQALVPGAASQLVKLWRDELEVIDEAGRYRVTTRDGRSLDEAVSEWLGSPDYAHFRRPSSSGGTTPRGDRRASAPGPRPTPPKNLGEAVLNRWREAAQSAAESGLLPVGLGRQRL